jgi:hypothetical protein
MLSRLFLFWKALAKIHLNRSRYRMRADLYSLLSNFGKGIQSRVSEPKDPSPVLSITRAGRTSSLPLHAGTHVIGGGAGCDFVILGIPSERAFSLLLTECSGRIAASISALRDDIIVGDRLLKREESVPVRARQAIRFDGTECAVEGLTSTSARHGRRKFIAAGLLVLAALFLFAGYRNDAPPGHAVLSFNAATPPDVRPTPWAIAEELRQAMRLAQLPANMAVTPLAMEIRVGENSPPLSFDSKTRLHNIIDALSRRSPVPIVDGSRLSSGLDGFVAAAGYVPVRFIVGTDGHRYQEGDTLASGWRISKIDPGEIIVARDGETDTIEFGFPAGDTKPRLAKNAVAEGN